MDKRIIKFRFWDVDQKVMLNDCDGWSGDVGINQMFESPNLVNLQFTGLLDKNGEEIYEGDVFNCIYYSDGRHTDHRYYVVYNSEMTDFRLRRVGNRCRQDQVYQHVRDVARYAKIGNIYENPELLEK